MRIYRFAVLMFVSSLCAMTITADTLSLVADINQTVTAGSIDHNGFVASQGLVFFTHTTSTTGTELWRSDGTEAGTFIAADVIVGRQSSSPRELVDWNGRLYFTGMLNSRDSGLWKTDGTEAGTELIAVVSDSSTFPRNLTPAGDRLYYTDWLGSLFATDGTDEGVQVGPGSAIFLTAIGDQLLFRRHGQLWISDGTPDGTTVLKDVPAQDLIPLGSDRVLFWVDAISGGGADQLWVTDGTAPGTIFVKDVQQVSEGQYEAVSVGDHVVFIGQDPVADREPWVTDGTPDGTFVIKDIDLGGNERLPENLTVVDNYVYFDNGNELWRTDGTSAGTSLVTVSTDHLSDAAGYNGLLYFAGDELQQSDGTAQGTGVAVNLDVSSNASPRGLTAANGWLWFSAFTPQTGEEVWRTDGTVAGTQVVSSIAGGTLGSDPQQLTGAGTTMFFTADNTINGRELWGSDSTLEGTLLLNDIYPGALSSEPNQLVDGDGIAYFMVNADVPSDAELWRSDGTQAGTQLVLSLPDTSFGFVSGPLTYLQGALWFGTRGVSFDDVRFWTSDGTPEGTMIFSSIEAETLSSSRIALAGDTLVLSIYSPQDPEFRLFRTDGTLTGTEQFATFFAQFGMSPSMTSAGDLLIFTTSRPGGFPLSQDLWSTDATEEGTTQLIGGTADTLTNAAPTQLTSVGDAVFFSYAKDGDFPLPPTDRELWITDGTPAGTQEVVNINATSSSSPQNLVATNNAVVFTASTPEAGRELWLSRGPDDTYQIADLVQGPEDSDISELFAVGGTVFFSANDNVNGEELWRSDGTLSGTRLAADVVPGSGGSDVADLAFVDGTLYFTADDGIHGRELWALTTNIAPWFTTLPADMAIENVEYSYAAEVTDANSGDTLTLTIVDAPTGAQFDAPTGLLTWTPTSNQVGLFTFELVVTDGDESATQTLRIEVLSDTDADMISDVQDNCSSVANVDQRDTNGDGFGNLCDADLDDNGIVNFADWSILVSRIFSNDPDADFDGDGSVNFADLAILRDSFLQPPGPSGVVQ